MNKQLLTMAAIYVGLSFSSCSKINGAGPVVTQTRNISGFTGIRSAMSGDIYIRQDSVYKVEIHAQQNIIDVLNTSKSGEVLKIDYDYNKRIGHHDKVEIMISCPDIRSLSISGSGNITVLNNCTPPSVDLSVSGSGTLSMAALNTSKTDASISGSGNIVVLDGSSGMTATDISGSGQIDMVGLRTGNADVHIAGSGTTKLTVQDVLNVRISGSGDVYYRGNPVVNSSISGSGKVKRL